MNPADQETVPIKPCCACGVGLLEESNFCRICGAHQVAPLDESIANARFVSSHKAMESYETGKLSRSIFCHPVSGPLVKAVADGVPASASRSVPRDLPKRVLFALMAIPI